MVVFYNILKNYNEIQLEKINKMDLNVRKMKNHPPFPNIYLLKFTDSIIL